MKKIVLFAALATVSFGAAADGWRFAPVLTDKDFKLEPTLAVTANRVDPRKGDNATSYGVDFNFNCGLVQDPQNRMRTHFNISQSDEKGVDVTAFELSPRYTVPLGNGLSAGVGPSLGVFDVDGGGKNETLVGIGLAGGLNYRVGALYAGADVRYHATNSRSSVNYDNWTAGAKLGINF
jgi:hypothetical protein